MTILTRGLGEAQQLITQGYGFSVTVISESGNEYQFGGVRKIYGKEGFQYLKDQLDAIIQTEQIIVGKANPLLEVYVTVHSPTVSVDEPTVQYMDHTIHITIN